MHSVTSNAVAEELSKINIYSDTETQVGTFNGYPLYARIFSYGNVLVQNGISKALQSNFPISKNKILKIEGDMIANSVALYTGAYFYVSQDQTLYVYQQISSNTYAINLIVYYTH